MVLDYFKEMYPDANFLEMNITFTPQELPVFDIYLVGNKWFQIKSDGKSFELVQFVFKNIPESDIPPAVLNIINATGKTVISVWHIYDAREGGGYVYERYKVYYSDFTTDEIPPDGTPQ